jgi:hypothetical protein
MEKELLVEIKEKATTMTIKEFSAEGAKMQYNSMGSAKGKYSASHMETVDVLQKQDGSNEWEARAIEMTQDGDAIMITAKGTGRMEGPTAGSFKGEGMCMTQSKKLAWLNSAKCSLEGTNNLKNNEATIKVYTMKV